MRAFFCFVLFFDVYTIYLHIFYPLVSGEGIRWIILCLWAGQAFSSVAKSFEDALGPRLTKGSFGAVLTETDDD